MTEQTRRAKRAEKTHHQARHSHTRFRNQSIGTSIAHRSCQSTGGWERGLKAAALLLELPCNLRDMAAIPHPIIRFLHLHDPIGGPRPPRMQSHPRSRTDSQSSANTMAIPIPHVRGRITETKKGRAIPRQGDRPRKLIDMIEVKTSARARCRCPPKMVYKTMQKPHVRLLIVQRTETPMLSMYYRNPLFWWS